MFYRSLMGVALLVAVCSSQSIGGEYTVNNLSNEQIWVVIYNNNAKAKDFLLAESGPVQFDEKKPIRYAGDHAYIRILRGGKAVNIDTGKEVHLPFCNDGPFTVTTTENEHVWTLRWRDGNGMEHGTHWERGTRLPPGWSLERYDKVEDKHSFTLRP